MDEEDMIVEGRVATRNDLAQNWETNNPILLKGELGVEIDTLRMKFGDGLSHYNDLRYVDDVYRSMLNVYTKDEIDDNYARKLDGVGFGDNYCDIQPSEGSRFGITIDGKTIQNGTGDPSLTNVRPLYGIGASGDIIDYTSLTKSSSVIVSSHTITFTNPASNDYIYIVPYAGWVEGATYTLKFKCETDFDIMVSLSTGQTAYKIESGASDSFAFPIKIPSGFTEENGTLKIFYNGDQSATGTCVFSEIQLNCGNSIIMPNSNYYYTPVSVNSLYQTRSTTLRIENQLFENDTMRIEKSMYNARYIVTGSEEWQIDGTAQANGYRRLYCTGFNISDRVSNFIPIVSNYYPVISVDESKNDYRPGISCVGGESGTVIVLDPQYQTVESWVAHLTELRTKGTPLTLFLQSNSYNGSNGLWLTRIIKNWNKITLKGTEGLFLSGDQSIVDGSRRMFIIINDNNIVGSQQSVNNVQSNMLKSVDLSTSFGSNIDCVSTELNEDMHDTRIYLRIKGIAIIATMKAKLKELYDAGTPIEIIYKLNKPNIYAYNYQPVLYALSGGENRVWSEGNITCMYNKLLNAEFDEVSSAFANLGTYINTLENKIAELEVKLDPIENDPDIVGLEVDLKNKKFTRLGSAKDKVGGSDFDIYPMYGGRKRCNVADNLTINAWYGDAGYKEDGTNGQVMVYQPKFYYKVIPIEMDKQTDGLGYHLRKAKYYISYKPKDGFKLHPAFYNEAGHEVEYVFIGAFKGCLYDTSASAYLTTDQQVADFTATTGDKLSSIANVKPCSGITQNLTRVNLEQLAKNRGTGWHLNTAKILMAQAMLEMIEYGECNIQKYIGNGFVSIPDQGSYSCSCNTGSTSSLGNASGMATQTTSVINGVTTNYTENGKLSVSYRGVEDPWGNIWEFTHDISIWGNGKLKGGVPYVCTDFEYQESKKDGNYESVGFTVSNNNGNISAFGYGTEKYDWFLIGSESSGDSNLPVGDYQWITSNLNDYRVAPFGGIWNYGLSCGAFCWHLHSSVGIRSRSIGGRAAAYPQ